MGSKVQVKIICFYTRNTPYEQEAIRLQASLESFGLPCSVDALPCRGSWEKNASQKPLYIYEKLCEETVPLLWVDADTVFLQPPDFSSFLPYDFGVRPMDFFEQNFLSTATLFINQTNEASKLVKAWIKKTKSLAKKNAPPHVDQLALFQTLEKNASANILPLPPEYCKIYDIDTLLLDHSQVVIEQRQAPKRARA